MARLVRATGSGTIVDQVTRTSRTGIKIRSKRGVGIPSVVILGLVPRIIARGLSVNSSHLPRCN
jgi:hypothetical protein